MIKKYTGLKRIFIVMCISGLLMSLSGCMAQEQSFAKASVEQQMAVRDNEALYETPLEESVLYLTVGWKSYSQNSDRYSWSDINSHDITWYETHNEPIHYCDALVQFGNEEGSVSTSYGYGTMSPNATVRLIGRKASKRPQKSYKIKINSGSGNISGIKNFNLTKSFGDPFRFLNKLSYDLMTEIYPLLSQRSNFVHLYVKDKSLGTDQLFVDYGLYTMTESVNKRYLSNRNLDSTGELYEVENFDFGRHENVIMQPTDSRFNQLEFEQLLEAEGSNDYSKLIKMLDDVNDDSKDIEEIVRTYFDEDNLYSFMAFNILMDNKDTGTENFYLYSPMGIDKFYIIPVDTDGALREKYELLRDTDYSAGWKKGIYLYTGSVLFSKILKNTNCITKLSGYIQNLHETVLSPDNVSEKANVLANIVKPYLFSLPDMRYARVTKEEYTKLLSGISTQMEENYYSYYDSILTPWPFHINEPVLQNGKLRLNWDESYILEGKISYDVELSDTWSFKKLLMSKTNIDKTSLDIEPLAPGQYFLKVTAKSDNGYDLQQEAYEYYNTETKKTIHGVMCFYVKDDGTVTKLTYK